MPTIKTNTTPQHTTAAAGENRATIVDEIAGYYEKYMVFSHPAQSKVLALWTIDTWRHSDSFPERPHVTAYLYVNSLEPGSGKTTLLNLMQSVVLNPEKADNMTASVMFRLIDSKHPTLLWDEVDTLFTGTKGSEDQRGVVNSGYKMGGYIWRTVNGEPEKFDTYGCKVLSGLDNGHLPETVATRCIEIMLEKVATLNDEGQLVGPDGIVREMYYQFLAEGAADHTTRRIQAFIADWALNYTRYMPKPIPGLSPRQYEVSFPLLQVAHQVGCEEEAIGWLKALFSHNPKKDSAEQAMLRVIQDTFAASEDGRLWTEEIVEALNAAQGGGWNGKLVSTRVRQFTGGGTTNITKGNRTKKGYAQNQFQAAFDTELS